MEEETRRFLEAEERANQLVDALEKLFEETNSYQSAKKELDQVRRELVNLIEVLREIIVGNREITRILGGINAQDIIQKLITLEDRFEGLNQAFSDVENRLQESSTRQESSLLAVQQAVATVQNALTDLSPRIDQLQENSSQQLARLERIERVERICSGLTTSLGKLSEGLGQIQKLVLITAGLSFLAVILGFIALFR